MAIKLSYSTIKMTTATKQIADTLSLDSHTFRNLPKKYIPQTKPSGCGGD